jgi:uncharacterized protein (DUF885 family)
MSGKEPGDNQALAQFQRFVADEWQYRMRENPLYATRCGDHRFNDRLPSVSEADAQRRLSDARAFLDRLCAIDPEFLPLGEQLDYRILRRQLSDRIADGEFHAERMPLTRLGGFSTAFAELARVVPLETTQDYENYVSRLSGFHALVEGYIELMRNGIASGHVLPRVALEGVEDTIRPHIVDDPQESRLYGPFARFPERIDATDRDRLCEAGRAAIQDGVVSGYRALLQFMQDEYIPAARDEIAASTLPDGRAFYEHVVLKYTTLDLTPQAVHNMGLEEVRRIRAEMEGIILQVGFEGDFCQFLAFLRSDPRFYVDSPEALMKEAALILKRIDGQLPRLFKTLPRTPYGIRPVPDYIAPQTTTAYYFPPAGDGTRAGFYYVNTYDLKSRPLYELEALSLHEAVPGHHLQIALQMELEDLPPFRRFGSVTAFIEGWALYAERLGLEVGFYEDPYSDFGRLTYEMWRACRLVVDTGMHYLGWTRQQAIDFMAENTALTMLNIANEVDRYISWPGQALAYKVGEIKLRQLRTQAEQELGTAFDLRAFHEVVLGEGGIPLDAVEANVRRWITEQRDQGDECVPVL